VLPSPWSDRARGALGGTLAAGLPVSEVSSPRKSPDSLFRRFNDPATPLSAAARRPLWSVRASPPLGGWPSNGAPLGLTLAPDTNVIEAVRAPATATAGARARGRAGARARGRAGAAAGGARGFSPGAN